MEFSRPVPHGQPGAHENTVMMTRIEENGQVFVHASDVQLLERETIEAILNWTPDVVLTSGPPLTVIAHFYHSIVPDVNNYLIRINTPYHLVTGNLTSVISSCGGASSILLRYASSGGPTISYPFSAIHPRRAPKLALT